MMIEKLQNSPNERFKISDDAQAEMLLLELGILDQFKKKPQPAATTQAVIYNEHPTHHILGVLYMGHPKAGDNGYLVICIPRSEFTVEQFHTFADNFLKPTPMNILGTKFFGGPPTSN